MQQAESPLGIRGCLYMSSNGIIQWKKRIPRLRKLCLPLVDEQIGEVAPGLVSPARLVNERAVQGDTGSGRDRVVRVLELHRVDDKHNNLQHRVDDKHNNLQHRVDDKRNNLQHRVDDKHNNLQGNQDRVDDKHNNLQGNQVDDKHNNLQGNQDRVDDKHNNLQGNQVDDKHNNLQGNQVDDKHNNLQGNQGSRR